MRGSKAIGARPVWALIAGGLIAASVPSASAGDGNADRSFPILGQASTAGRSVSGDAGVITVHGVRRVEGATIVYWSLAVPAGVSDPSELLGVASNGYADNMTSSMETNVGLIDYAGQRLFRPLVPEASKECVCSGLGQVLEIEPGQAGVLWSALVELPDEVTIVDVAVADQIIPAVPVEDGPMEPLAKSQAGSPDGVVIAGMGWPKIDTDEIANSTLPEPQAFPLRSPVSDLQRTITKAKGEVALNADVLFAKDSADVSADGKQAIAKAADQIKEAKAGDKIAVVGHTDSDAADQYNLDLSRRRADAVAGELRPLLGGSFTVTTDGKGESEPVATNDTDAGKAKNRRVTISYTGGS